MPSTNEDNNLAREVAVGDDYLRVSLPDGRVVSAPLSIYPSLERATREQRADHELIGDGEVIYWPSLDLHLTVEGIVQGRRESFPPPPPLPSWARPSRSLQVVEMPAKRWALITNRGATSASVFPTKKLALEEAARIGALAGRSRLTISIHDRRGRITKRVLTPTRPDRVHV